MKILVAFGSKRGGTEGLAEMLATDLVHAGAEVVVEPANAVGSLAGFDAAVIGGSLYMGRWHRDAVRLVRKHATELRQIPVWFFSSGPLGEDAEEHPDVPPVDKVAGLMESVGARGHVTFGGVLEPDAKGFIASKMAANLAGDWRDRDEIAAWATEIVSDLSTPRPATS